MTSPIRSAGGGTWPRQRWAGDAPALSLEEGPAGPAAGGSALDDPERLAALRDYGIVGTGPEPAFDEFVELAAIACGTPMALISLVDENHRWLKAQVGLGGPAAAVPVEQAFCGHSVATGRPLIVPDAAGDPRFATDPVVAGSPWIRFYGGMPLTSPGGHVLGALAVLDVVPRALDDAALGMLERVSKRVVDVMELRVRTRELELERQVLASTGEVLGLITHGAGLREVLTSVARAVEAQDPDVLCSILLVDGDVLRDGAGPSLPGFYRDAIDGIRHGPGVGSCGTAVATRQRVITEDIATDPRWDGYRELAQPAGLRACWSSPILDPDGEVLGTFAQYFRTPRVPEPRHWDLVQRWAGLAGLAIIRTRAQELMRRMALTDPLTGLPNRTGLLTAYAETARAGPNSGGAALLLMDLDRFKVLNDSLGHAVGDEYLATVAGRLALVAGERAIVSRFGGDEFVVLAPGLTAAGAKALGQRLADVVREPVVVHDRSVVLSASVGIAMAGPRDHDANALLRSADAALYRAKDLGRDRVVVFDAAMHGQALRRLELEADLRDAIARCGLSVAYQAKVDLTTGLVDGVEALARWHHPTRGEVEPADFIPVAEDCGLIAPLGRWVLRTALAAHAARRATDPSWDGVTMWVNVSVAELAADLVPSVTAALADSGVPPDRLGLEVTETSLATDMPTVRESLLGLRELGVRLAIDDFGTGYSSLSQLKLLPVDVLKIDKSFVDGLGHDRIDDGVVEAVVALGRAHGLRVVAEGVESVEQYLLLRGVACDCAQGYVIGVPGSLDDIVRDGFRLPRALVHLPPTCAPAPAVRKEGSA